ncbi:hypothetical protein Scep_019040 [Stephania cephalantha]|uniref:Uncharacterized protein n=1 Tax=Stephania cephalantha TaxID=152367 RepID=A0AAP0NPG0_9MAGN
MRLSCIYLSWRVTTNGAHIDLGGHHQSRARRHAGAGSSWPMSARDEPIKQLRGDIKPMQRSFLRVINDKTLDRDQLHEMQGRLGRMEQALMDRLGISFAPPADPDNDSETNQDLDD